MEIHLVHWKLAYDYMQKALNERDGLAVIAIMLTAKQGNNYFSALKVNRNKHKIKIKENFYLFPKREHHSLLYQPGSKYLTFY